MCLILFSINSQTNLPLVIAANRDEFYSRPTRSAAFWEDKPHLLAGKDLEAGGTWMGVTRDGRFAALTNFRSPIKNDHSMSDKKTIRPLQSRGELVRNFLAPTSDQQHSLLDYAALAINNGANYAGFNLLLSDGKSVVYCNNFTNEVKQLSSGVYALSNHLLDTPWPKVVTGKTGLSNILSENESFFETNVLPESLFDLLRDNRQAMDELLPNTGLDIEKERMLSSLFIESENYGTCCSTAIIFNSSNQVYFHERNYYTHAHKTHHALLSKKTAQQDVTACDNDNIFDFLLEK